MNEKFSPISGDNPSLPADERLHIHSKGIQALSAYNEGVISQVGSTDLAYSAGTVQKLLDSAKVILDNAHAILQERDVLLSAVNDSIKMLTDYNDTLDAQDSL